MPGDASPIVRGGAGCRQGIDLVNGCVFGRVGGDPQSCGHFRACSGSVNSFPFVRSFVRSFVLVLVVVDATICAADMVRRYGATIWCDDMHRRYGEPICKA